MINIANAKGFHDLDEEVEDFHKGNPGKPKGSKKSTVKKPVAKRRRGSKEIEIKVDEGQGLHDLLERYGLEFREDYSYRYDKSKDSFFVSAETGSAEMLIEQAKSELKRKNTSNAVYTKRLEYEGSQGDEKDVEKFIKFQFSGKGEITLTKPIKSADGSYKFSVMLPVEVPDTKQWSDGLNKSFWKSFPRHKEIGGFA